MLETARKLATEIIDFCDENMHKEPCPKMCHKCGMLRTLKQKANELLAELNKH